MTTLEQVDKRVAVLETQIRNLATKEDLANLKTDIANIKTDIANVKFDLLKWLVPIMLGQTAAVFAAARFWSG